MFDTRTEIEKIRENYALRDQSLEIRNRWAPFAKGEVWHRNQQQAALSELFRDAGWESFRGKRILDVGCGVGRFLRQCLDYGASPEELYGVDLSDGRIGRATALSPNLHFSVCNGETLEFSDDHFDLVTQFVVFSSIYSDGLRRQLASEMLRVLKPGGYVFWWDALLTVHEEMSAKLSVSSLFPGVNIKKSYANLGLAKGLLSWRRAPGGFLRALRYRGASHVAALIGPKPGKERMVDT